MKTSVFENKVKDVMFTDNKVLLSQLEEKISGIELYRVVHDSNFNGIMYTAIASYNIELSDYTVFVHIGMTDEDLHFHYLNLVVDENSRNCLDEERLKEYFFNQIKK
jgi:hypothetical protein